MTGTGNLCRGCGAGLGEPFLDLGVTPLANSYLRAEDLPRAEPFYPLQVSVCGECFLVQVPAVQTPEAIFDEYAYFSSFSTAWLKHVEEYADRMVHELGLGSESLVVEIASNDGYLLQFFKRRGIPVLGIEPARNVAEAARAAGIPTLTEFFGTDLARRLADERKQADLVIANNVLAHVPGLNDFVGGLRIILKPRGLLTLEFPHLLRLVNESQFDTIYHEHFSYLSLGAVRRVFERHGLAVVDVEELWTHGGSLRVHARHRDDDSQVPSDRVARLIAAEEAAGLTRLDRYEAFANDVLETKRALLDFLICAKRKGQVDRRVRGPGKGQHPAELLRRADRLSRLHGRPKPSQAGPVPARYADPDLCARANSNHEAGLRADFALESQRRDCGADEHDPGVGRPVRGADPTSRDLLMRFAETELPEVWIVTPELKEDSRGFFARTWCEREFAARGITDRWVQCSISFNVKKGTVRGLHYQRAPREEAKLVRCTMGKLYDVVVDIRPGSPTFKKHVALELSAANRKMLYIARGCAHGFQTLEDETEVFYQISEFYSPDHAQGLRWDDPALGIRWPLDDPIISDRDRGFPDFAG